MKTIQDLQIYLENLQAKDNEFGLGSVKTEIMKQYSSQFIRRYNINETAYWCGFYLADSKVTEAEETGEITINQNLAINWLNDLSNEYEIEESERQIISDIIMTQDTVESKFKEAQIFTNVEAISSLEPRFILHYVAKHHQDAYDDVSFRTTIGNLKMFIENRMSLIDIDQQTIDEAKALKDRFDWMVMRMGVQ